MLEKTSFSVKIKKIRYISWLTITPASIFTTSKTTERDEHYWSNTLDAHSRKSWAGLTFEQVCKDHIRQIKHKIGILGILSEQFSWFSRGNKELGIEGAQIDLLIDRKDRVINLCEIKFYGDEYVIDIDEDTKIRNRMESFRRNTKTRKAIQIIYITTYGVKKNIYSGIVQKQVTLDDLFEKMEV